MKFLCVSDLHANMKQVKLIVERAKQGDIDFVIEAGDFSAFGHDARKVLDAFEQIGKPVYVIPGNHEEGPDFEKLLDSYSNCQSIDRQAVELDNGYVLLGYGGGGFAQRDEEFRKLSRKWYGQYKVKPSILITHGPAVNTKLDALGQKHVGNIDYRKFIERMKPKLAISGHIHESAGEQDTIGETICVNPCWEGMVIEVE